MLLHRLPDRHGDGLGAGVGEQGQHLVLHLVESLPVLVLRVDEEFHLHLVELPHPDHTLPGGDLVPVAPSGLHDPERELLPVVSVEVQEVDEDPLGGLGSEESDAGRPGSDVGPEHQVEILHGSQLPAAFEADDIVVYERLVELLFGHDVGVLVELLHQVVGAEGRAAFGTVRDLVGEFVEVSGRLEDVAGIDGLRVDLHEPLAAFV